MLVRVPYSEIGNQKTLHPLTLNLIQGLKLPQKGNRVYRPEALKTIRAIEENYKINWNNDAQRQQLTYLNLENNHITDLSPPCSSYTTYCLGFREQPHHRPLPPSSANATHLLGFKEKPNHPYP